MREEARKTKSQDKQNDNNARQNDKNVCKSFPKFDNPMLVELFPKKP